MQVEKPGSRAPLSCLPARRRGFPASQYGIYAGRDRIFPRRCAAACLRLRSGRRDEALPVATRPAPHVETLGAPANGSLSSARGAEPLIRRCPARARRPGGDFLHVRHYGTLQRSDADPWQPGLECADAGGVWRFTGDDVLLHALPIYHTHGLFVATNVVLFAGGIDDLPAEIRSGTDLRFLPQATSNDGRADLLHAAAAGSAPHARGDGAYASVHLGLGAAAGRNTPRMAGRTGHAILERYGMTETNMNTSNPYDGERIAGTVGCRCRGSSVRIADPATGAPVAPGEIGMIEVKGPNVFKGYWRMPEKTAAEFRAGRIFHHRRPRQDRRARLCLYRRARQGSGDFRRLERLSEGSRKRDRRAAGRCRKRGDRPRPPRFRRGRDRDRRAREGGEDRRDECAGRARKSVWPNSNCRSA